MTRPRPMVLTNHARMRWAQRCAGLDPQREWFGARRATPAQRRRLKQLCPGHTQFLGRAFHGRYVAVSPAGVVLIVHPKPSAFVVITVFRPEWQ